MILALMDNTAAGISFLVAIILFLVAAFLAWGAKAVWATLVAVGLAAAVLPFCWDRFSLS